MTRAADLPVVLLFSTTRAGPRRAIVGFSLPHLLFFPGSFDLGKKNMTQLPFLPSCDPLTL